MTAFGSSPEFKATFIDGVAPIEDLPATDRSRAVAFPGRWVGGVLGVIATVLLGIPLALVGWLTGDGLALGAAAICILGLPIAFVLGRHLAPIAVEGGGSSPTSAVLTFALLAPLLGNAEIVAGAVLLSPGPIEQFGSAVALGVIVAVVGCACCFVALPVTAAVAVVWLVLMRSFSAEWMAEHRAPMAIQRVGVRHALVAVVVLAAAVRVLATLLFPTTSGW